LSTDYVLRTGCHDENRKEFNGDMKAMQAYALERYNKARDSSGEILISGSDDLTMFMWQPKKTDKSLHRLTGHKQLVI
jgi:ribosome assembly protein 4